MKKVGTNSSEMSKPIGPQVEGVHRVQQDAGNEAPRGWTGTKNTDPGKGTPSAGGSLPKPTQSGDL